MSNNNKINIDDKVNADTINSIAGCKAEDDNKTTANVSTAPTTVNEKAETKGATTNQKSFNDQRKGIYTFQDHIPYNLVVLGY